MLILDLDPWATISCAGFFIHLLWEANLFSRISRSYQIISVHRGSQRAFAFTPPCSSAAQGAGLRRAPALMASRLGCVWEGSQEGGWLWHLSNPQSSSRKLVYVPVMSWHLLSLADYFCFTWALKQSPPTNRMGWFFAHWTADLQNTLSVDAEVNMAWREKVEILGRNTHLIANQTNHISLGNLLNWK